MTKIRPLTEADIDQAAAVHVRGWQIGYAGIVPDVYLAGLDPAARAQGYRERGAPRVVAETHGRIAGIADFGPYRPDNDEGSDSRMGELYAIYVDPDHWGEGVGGALIDAVKATLAADGFADMRLWVLTDNRRARRFYERHGMRPDGATQSWTPRGSTTELPELRYAVPL